MTPGDSDPTAIRSIAVTATDIVAAIEARETTDRDVVLRITPPFSGRMRARLHDADAVSGAHSGGGHPLSVDPESLLDSSAPSYPTPDETESRLRADPDRTYDLDSHRDCHEAAVERWREAIPDAVKDSVSLSTPDGVVTVRVHVLG